MSKLFLNVGFVSGSADMTPDQYDTLQLVFEGYDDESQYFISIHHNNITKSDIIVKKMAKDFGFYCQKHSIAPPNSNWEERVLSIMDIIIACPETEDQNTGGPWPFLEDAVKNKKHILIIQPDGNIRNEI